MVKEGRIAKETTEVRKQQIIQATLQIIAEKGITGLTTSELAKSVGFSEAALFRHYPSKASIIKAAMLYAHELMFEGITQITSKDLGPLTKLEEILNFQLSFIEENRGVPRILFSDELHIRDRDLRQTIMSRHRKYLEIIISVIEEGVFSGIFRNDLDAKMAARTFFGLIQTAIFNNSLQEFRENLTEQYKPIKSFLRGCFMARYHCG